MMIISHRGYWKTKTEKNSQVAFERSVSLGFGIETDIRDFNGMLVISHDIPNERSMLVEDLFGYLSSFRSQLMIAINIKSDGLQGKLKELLQKYKIDNYFVFDMSVADGLLYLNQDFKVFTRQSEYERVPSFYNDAQGVWLDEFHTHWIDRSIIERHFNNKKMVCIVSPEIHQRDYNKEWKEYRILDRKIKSMKLFLCTDFPEKAKEFFNG